MFYCTINNVFCTIAEIGDCYVNINANGHIYTSSLDALVAF